MRILQTFDYYKLPIQLHIQGFSSHYTPCGCFLTLCLLSVFLFITYNFSLDILERKQPDISSMVEYVQIPDKINISPMENPLMFGIMNSETWKFVNDESLLYATVTLNIANQITEPDGTQSIPIIQETHKAVKCTREHFQIPDLDKYLDQLDITNLFCIDYAKFSVNPYVEGNYGFERYTGIAIDFFKCKDGEGVSCRPQDEIDSIFKLYYSYLYYTDLEIDNSNFTQPFQQYLGMKYFPRFLGSCTQLTFQPRPVTLISDTGLILEDSEQFGSHEMGTSWVSNIESDILFQIIIEANLSKSTINRRYQKLSKVAAEVGGFMNVIIIISVALYSVFSQTHYYSTLVQNARFLDFDKHIKEMFEINNQGSSVIQNNNLKQDLGINKLENFTGIQEQSISFVEQLEDINSSERRGNIQESEISSLVQQSVTSQNQVLSTTELFLFSFPCCFQNTKKNQAFQNQVRLLQSELDIENMLLKFQEIEFLKYYLLNRDERVLLNYQVNRHIRKEEAQQIIQNILTCQDKSNSGKLKDILKYKGRFQQKINDFSKQFNRLDQSCDILEEPGDSKQFSVNVNETQRVKLKPPEFIITQNTDN